MGMIEPMILEFEQEAASTRKMLERVPADAMDWRPHKKSMSMAELASHIANIPEWAKATLTQDELIFDMANYKPNVYESPQEALEVFERGVKEVIEVMRVTSDDQLMAMWRMKDRDTLLFEMPRIAVLRGMILNHAVHHRGQLSVYLRMKDVPLPAIYGPSADEGM